MGYIVSMRHRCVDRLAEGDNPPAARGHVLLVNYFFPPMAGGGVLRPVKMGKYLHRLGWTVTVLTVAPSQMDERLNFPEFDGVVRVREWRMAALLRVVGDSVHVLRRGCERFAGLRTSGQTLLERGFAYEEQEIQASKIGWVVPGVRAAMRIHRRHTIDIAIVSLPPAASGMVGWLLRRLQGVPYLVEYRDPWTVDAFWTTDADGRPRTDPVTRTRLWITSRLEATMLRGSAGSIIVNGREHVGRLTAKFSKETRHRPIAHIRNGVDLEDTERLGLGAPDPTLHLLHTGFFYHFYTPHHLITALRLVQRDHPEVLSGVELEFMGDGFPEQLALDAEAWGLGSFIRRRAAGPYSDALMAMHRADGLIAVLPPLDSDRDRLPTKLYEYLSTDRPIIAVAHVDGAAARLLDGVPDTIVADNTDQAAIATALVDFIALARRRRAHGYPPESRLRGEPHHYQERAVVLDAHLRHVLAFAATLSRAQWWPRPRPRGRANRRTPDTDG
jgi:glycosyltransferase involved in cell wall biosynthesis